MSSNALNLVWRMTEPKGTDRLILIALADHAGHDGLVSVPVRKLADCASVSKSAAAEAVSRLQRDGHIAVVDHGASPTKSPTYRIIFGLDGPDVSCVEEDTAQGFAEPKDQRPPAMPDKAQPAPQPHKEAQSIAVGKGHPETLVGEILTAARVPPPSVEPFRWFSRRHNDAAGRILDLFNGDRARMVEALSRLKVKQDIISLNPILTAARERAKAGGRQP